MWNLYLFRFSCDHTILHPGAIKVIMTLLPHIYCPSNPQVCNFITKKVHWKTITYCSRTGLIMRTDLLSRTLLFQNAKTISLDKYTCQMNKCTCKYDHLALSWNTQAWISTGTLLWFLVFPLQMSVELQLAVADHVQTLVKSERNRQIMCESNLVETLLSHCRYILSNSTHSLHLPVVRILEKLASQSINHKSLRLVSKHFMRSLVDSFLFDHLM